MKQFNRQNKLQQPVIPLLSN